MVTTISHIYPKNNALFQGPRKSSIIKEHMSLFSRLRSFFYTTLRRSERIFKTDMVYLAKGGFWMSASGGILAVISFLLSIVFANLLPQEAYGNYRYILSIAGILAGFSLTGLTTVITQSVAKGYEGILRKGFWVNLKWSMGITIVSLGIGCYYLAHGNTPLAYSMFAVGVILPFIQSLNLYASFLVGKRDFRLTAITGVLYEAIPALVLALALLFTKSFVILVILYLASHAMTSLFLYKKTLSKYKPTEHANHESLRYGKQLSFLNILTNVASYIDKIIVFQAVGAKELAIYSFSLILTDRIRSLIKSISNLALPKFSAKSESEIRSTLPSKIVMMTIATLIVSGLYAVVAPWLYHVFFPLYMSSVPYTQLASLTFVGAVSSVIGSALYAQEKIRSITVLSIGAPLIRIALFFILGYKLGIVGMVIAQVAYQWITLAMFYAALLYLKK